MKTLLLIILILALLVIALGYCAGNEQTAICTIRCRSNCTNDGFTPEQCANLCDLNCQAPTPEALR